MRQKRNFFDMATQVIEKWKESKSPSTNANYMTALRSLKKFTEERKISNFIVNESLVKAYEHWLRGNGVSLNTISCYMRSLRSLHHQLGGKNNPFEKAFTGSTKTEKRAITPDDIRRIQHLDLSGSAPLQFARDLFLFSIYTLGMPFVDMAYLQKHNIQGDFIVYQRHKTHQTIRVPLEPCMTEIIQKYEQPSSDRVFPIIHASNRRKTPYEQYLHQLGAYNKRLKKLAHRAKIRTNLTSYVTRHTWASLAYHRNTELAVISKALGHTNPNTTQIYIREIDDNRLVEANRALLGQLLEPNLI